VDHLSRQLSHDPAKAARFSPVEEFAVDFSGALPDAYGDDRLVALPRDPYWFFAYWEVTPARFEKLRQEHGTSSVDSGVLVLRVYDVTGHENDGLAHAPYFDVQIPRDVTAWYVNVPKSGQTYQTELGIRLPDGRFLALLRSNRVRLPLGKVSDQTDSRWMAVSVQSGREMTEDQRFAELSKGLQGIGKGSAEIAKTMAQRWEFLKSVFSGASSSGSSSSSSWPRAPERQDEQR
jgi:hypothetical protein